jgi:nitrite reductase/ring-hydroxylating ferredoxin subunit
LADGRARSGERGQPCQQHERNRAHRESSLHRRILREDTASPRLKDAAMDEFVRIFSLDEVAPGTARVATVGGYDVGVFNVDGTIYAIDNLCPHVDGPLHGGKVNNAACTVTCPLHGREFSLVDGTEGYGRQSVVTFDVSVRDDEIYVASTPRPLVAPGTPRT